MFLIQIKFVSENVFKNFTRKKQFQLNIIYQVPVFYTFFVGENNRLSIRLDVA